MTQPTRTIPSRRRQFFIKKEFQSKFILLYALGIIALAGLATLALYRAIEKAIESHLYSSHLKIERSGELLFGILFETNTLAIFAIVLVVMLLSLTIFTRLNRHFHNMEERLDSAARGEPVLEAPPKSRFHEISKLIHLVELTLQTHRQRQGEIVSTLTEIETGLRKGAGGEQLRAGKAKLEGILRQVELP